MVSVSWPDGPRWRRSERSSDPNMKPNTRRDFLRQSGVVILSGLAGGAVVRAASSAVSASALDLGAAVRPVPLTARFIDPDYFIWCGSMTRTPDGKCHLFYSRWPKALGHDGWVTHSEVAYAVADDPFGPFGHVNVALPARDPALWDGMVTHNPNIVRIGGKFCLYYMGNRGDGKSYWIHRNNQRVGVAIASDPRGPWQRFNQPIVDVSENKAAFDSLCTTNPAACVRPDGSVLLIYKAVTDNGTPRGGRVRFGAATAARPDGPYTKAAGEVFAPTAAHREAWMVAEDPFVWYSRRFGDRYYALSRDVVGMFTGAEGGITLLESPDGLAWRAAAHPAVLGKDFGWADGSRSGTKLERPQLYIDEAGIPRVLYGAVDVNEPKRRSHAYNVAIPLEVQA